MLLTTSLNYHFALSRGTSRGAFVTSMVFLIVALSPNTTKCHCLTSEKIQVWISMSCFSFLLRNSVDGEWCHYSMNMVAKKSLATKLNMWPICCVEILLCFVIRNGVMLASYRGRWLCYRCHHIIIRASEEIAYSRNQCLRLRQIL